MDSSTLYTICVTALIFFFVGRFYELSLMKRKEQRKKDLQEGKVPKKPILTIFESEEEREKREAAKRAETEELARQQALIKEQYQAMAKKANDYADEHNERSRTSAHDANSRCSSCRSTKVSTIVKQDNGKDYSVIKCKECGNEKKKQDWNYKTEREILAGWIGSINYLLRKRKEILDCTFDPKDITEKFTSLEEKREALMKAFNEDKWNFKRVDDLKEFALETIYEAATSEQTRIFTVYEAERFKELWDPEYLKTLGFKDIRWKEQEKRDVVGILDL